MQRKASVAVALSVGAFGFMMAAQLVRHQRAARVEAESVDYAWLRELAVELRPVHGKIEMNTAVASMRRQVSQLHRVLDFPT